MKYSVCSVPSVVKNKIFVRLPELTRRPKLFFLIVVMKIARNFGAVQQCVDVAGGIE